MVEQINIPLENKLTKEIKLTFSLDNSYWDYFEYDNSGKLMYFENSNGYISDD